MGDMISYRSVSSKYNDHPPKRVVITLVLDGTIRQHQES
jgi:hypothetical protein